MKAGEVYKKRGVRTRIVKVTRKKVHFQRCRGTYGRYNLEIHTVDRKPAPNFGALMKEAE
jgi:hypothetical protein